MSPSASRTDHPPLLRSKIVEILEPLVARAGDLRFQAQLSSTDKTEVLDLLSTYSVAQHAKTILFSTEQALALKPALERFGEELREYRLPFPATLIQFTEPIGESQLLPYPEELPVPDALPGEDKILALLLTQNENEEGQLLNTAGFWFQSRSVNRVTWIQESKAHLRLREPGLSDAEQRLANKVALRNLAIACIAYINCENISLEHKPADAKVNRSRVSKGKKPFDDYYICHLRTARGETGEADGDGSKHVFRYDVRAHFRRLPDGRLTWVRAHQRGLAHELYVPSVRKVD